nr:high light inducible protein [Prochlorococcus marinus]
MVSLTALVVAYLTKQFQENLIYSNQNQMNKTNSNTKTKTIEKEKAVAETINGRFAMLGLMAAIGAYLTTGQIIPGFV